MNAQQLTIAVYSTTGVGIALLLINAAFPVLMPAKSAWSEEDALEFTAAATELHHMTHAVGAQDHGHGTTGDQPGPADLAAAKERWEKQEQNLQSTLSGRATVRSVIKWLGIVLAVAGICAAIYLRFGFED